MIKKKNKSKDVSENNNTDSNNDVILQPISDSVEQDVSSEVPLHEIADKNLSSSMNEISKKEISDSLKEGLYKVISLFSKHVSKEVLYSNIALDEEKNLQASDIIQIAKKAGLLAEVRRINLLDIKTGPVIALGSKNCYVVIDKKKGYDTILKKEEDFDPNNFAQEYIGYAIFFYEENLTVSSFVEKTGFLFKSVAQFRPIFIELLVISFFINIFAVVSPIYTMNVYDRVIPNYAISTLFVLSFGMLIVYLFDFAFKMIKSYLSDYISLSIGNEVDQVLLTKLLLAKSPGLSMSNGAKNSLFKELAMVREFYFSRFIPALIDIPFLILFFAVLLLISPWLALVPFVAALLVFVVNILLQVPLQSSHSKMIGEDQNRNGFLVETISGSESIKTFNAVGKSLYKWKRTLDRTYQNSYRYNLWVNGASNFSVLMMNFVTVFIVFVGVFEINSHVMTTGGLVASSTISARIMSNVIGFSGMIVRYRSINSTLRHLEKIIFMPSEDDSEAHGNKGTLTGDIKFKNISFFYPGLKQPILHNCNFTINPGDKVALIGKTGAGKSTITRLILGLDFPNNGQIFFDNIDSHHIHLNEIRSNIGYMPQKSFFFTGSVRENILFGSSSVVSEEQYQRACDLAGVSLVTSGSARGDDMKIVEGGRNLSGGQQQIIALARAIINDPQIIIMDEPTNGMDTVLEAAFMGNVREYVKDKTFILVTHKPSQLSLVDRVMLIDNATVAIDDTKEKVIEILSKKSN